MRNLYYFLIISLVGLFIYNMLPKTKAIEGLENNGSCDANTLIYKNSGTIQSLQDKVDQLMKQVNQVIISDDKQASEIQGLQKLNSKVNDLAQQAKQLEQRQKQQILANAAEKKAKMSAATKESDSIKFE